MMYVFFIFVFVGLVSGQEKVIRECSPIDELRCDDGYCIRKLQWCDTSVDCWDGSDESYCNKETPCQSIHFRCRNGKCIPSSAVCDAYDDCYDHSDEDVCDGSGFYLADNESNSTVTPTPNSEGFQMNFAQYSNNTREDAVAKAVRYLMSTRDADYSWSTFTPRAVVALKLASKISPMPDKEVQLMQKQLNIQLLLNLMEDSDQSLSKLALYINALYATCQDPRSFQGVDLVARLRSKTDVAMKSNLSVPLAFLTLCISNNTKYDDSLKLAEMYNTKGFSRTGSRALIMMAMICIMRKDGSGIFRHFVNDFFNNESEKAETADIYTQALFMQASNAAGYETPTEELVRKQLPDGSFGDMLATYYAIPVLMKTSVLKLMELSCDSKEKGILLESRIERTDGENEVVVSLWLTYGTDLNSHSVAIRFDGRRSLFDIMMMAATRDPMYRFLYDESISGKMVYSLANIPNDIESGISWVLYSGNIDSVKLNSVHNLHPEFDGIDKIFPDDKDHFVFWLKRISPTIPNLF